MVKTTLFCKYCASPNIGKTIFKTKDLTDKTFEPKISLTGPESTTGSMPELGIGLGHLTRKKSRELLVETTLCNTCRNIDAGISARDSNHLEVESSASAESIIIPHSLSVLLRNSGVEDDEITSGLQGIRKKFQEIYTKWKKTGGINQCKCNKVGKKLMFEIKLGLVITCWIIIDSIGSKMVFRLAYGGGKVVCQ